MSYVKTTKGFCKAPYYYDIPKVSYFHNYKVFSNGVVLSKSGKILKQSLRERRGGKYDYRATLYINGKQRHFTMQRLVAACFLGPLYGYEVNHINRNTLDNRLSNLERVTASENQKHWRSCELTT